MYLCVCVCVCLCMCEMNICAFIATYVLDKDRQVTEIALN